MGAAFTMVMMKPNGSTTIIISIIISIIIISIIIVTTTATLQVNLAISHKLFPIHARVFEYFGARAKGG